MILVRERSALVNAVSSLCNARRREAARRFLEGLSADELEYIAAYFGASLIESHPISAESTREEIAVCIQRYDRASSRSFSRAHSSHRMMVLLEYLSMNRSPQSETVPVTAVVA